MKILLIRSCTLKLFRKNFERIRNDFPKSSISVLTQPSVKDEIARTPYVNEVIEYCGREPSFSVFNTPLSFFWKLRKKRFEYIIILYNNLNGATYGNVINFAFVIGSSKIKAYNSSGECLSFNEIYTKRMFLDFILGILEHRVMVRMILGINTLYKNTILIRESFNGLRKRKVITVEGKIEQGMIK